jgi:hypothetical protein
VEDYVEEGGVDLEATVVFDEAHFAEFVHEEIDAGAGGANHFGQDFLGHFRNFTMGLIFLAVTSEQEKGAGEALFAGIEKLVDEVFFDADVAGEHVGDENIGERVLGAKNGHHFLFFDEENGSGEDGRGGTDAKRVASEAAFPKKIAGAENGDDSFFAGSVDDGKLDATFLNVADAAGGIALRINFLRLLELDDGASHPGAVEKGLQVEEKGLGWRRF